MKPRYSGQKNVSFGVASTVKYWMGGTDKENLPDPALLTTRDDWTPSQLDAFADAILWKQIDGGKDNRQEPMILLHEHLHERRKREIYCTHGVPDDEVLTDLLSPDGHRMYWRTHPQGRTVNSEESRLNKGASFYR